MGIESTYMFGDWGPYVRIPSALGPAAGQDAALRAMLHQRTIQQVRGIIDTIDRRETEQLPPIVRSLDQETGGFASQRIVCILSGLLRLLSRLEDASDSPNAGRDLADNNADVRETLAAAFDPIQVAVCGQPALTSPALLVVQAVLFSHAEWFREYVFEAYSAARAYRELDCLGIPDAHCRFIAALIAHGTLLRVSWDTQTKNDPLDVIEVVPYRRQRNIGTATASGVQPIKWVEGDEAPRAVGIALARTLFRFLDAEEGEARWSSHVTWDSEHTPLRRQLASALVLFSLSLFCRHLRSKDARLDKVKRAALASLDHLLASPPAYWSDLPAIAFLQYGKYVAQASTGLFESAKDQILEKVNAYEGSSLPNISFCFQRVSTKHVWREVGETIEQPDKLSLHRESVFGDEGEPGPVQRLIAETTGAVHAAKINPLFYLRASLGISGSTTDEQDEFLRRWIEEPMDENAHIGALRVLLDAAKTKHLRYLGDVGGGATSIPYFPAPLVGRVLEQMRDCRPEAFTPLHIVPRQVGSTPGEARIGEVTTTIWLPKRAPEIEEPAERQSETETDTTLWRPNESAPLARQPDVLIVRYVAAMILAKAPAFTPGEILVDFYSEQARGQWRPLIKDALAENGWHVMELYSTHLRCSSAHVRFLDDLETLSIGALKKERLGDMNCRICGMDIGGTAIKYGQFYASDLIGNTGTPEVEDTISAGDAKPFLEPREADGTRCVAFSTLTKELGLRSIPESTRHYGISVAAPVTEHTGVPLAPSGALTTWFGMERAIAKSNPLDFHQLDVVSEMGLRRDFVKMVNDGVAAIRDGEGTHAISPEGISIIVKEGTGVAFAVYADGRPVGLAAETAKSILNLECVPQPKPRKERFPEGVVGNFCSKEAFDRLREWDLLRLTYDSDGADLGTLIGQLLHDALDGKVRRDGLAANYREERGTPWIATDDFLHDHLGDLKGLFDQATRIGMRRDLARTRRQIDEQLANCDDQAIRENRLAPQDYKKLGVPQKLAICAAWILGRWLADAIAMVVGLYGAREVQLGGGPLSGKTEIFVARSASRALEEVYGFDLEVEEDPATAAQAALAQELVAAYRVKEVRRLRFIYPPEDSDTSGPRGAAKCALEAYADWERRRQLLACRDIVAGDGFPLPGGIGEFGPEYVRSELKRQLKVTNSELLIEDGDVQAMLEHEAASLGLVRKLGAKFEKYRQGRQ